MSGTGLLERWVMGLAVFGMLGTGAYFLMPEKSLKRVELSESTNIGSVKPVGADVRLRGTKDLNWNTIKKDTQVYQSDKIFTGSKSSAVVTLKSQQQLTVEPNSLIMIGDQDKSVYVDMNSTGGFLGEIKKGVKFFVKRDKSNFELEGDGSVVSVYSRKKEELKMVVLRGEAQIKTAPEAKPVKIVKNVELTVSEQKTESKTLPIQIQTPEAASTIWANGESIHFSWSGGTDRETSEGYVVEISQDPLFADSVENVRTKATSVQINISKSGVYFWRVRELAKGRRSLSAIASFSVYPSQPPVIHKDAVIDAKTDWRGVMENLIVLAWNDPSLSEYYEVEASRDESFGEVLYKEKTEDQKMQIAHIKEGQFFWRVTSYHPSRAQLTSEVGRVRIQKAEPTPSVEPLSDSVPLTLASTATPEPRGEPIEEPIPEALPDLIPEPAQSMVAEAMPELVSEPAAVPTPEPILLKELQAPELKRKWSFTLKKKSTPVALFWAPVEGAEGYEVEIAASHDFQKILHREEVADTKWLWQEPTLGSSFFRVKALRGAEKASSEVASLVVKDNPLSLKVKLEERGPEQAPVIHAAWTASAFSEQAELELSQNNIVLGKEKVQGTRYKYTVSEPGTYAIRVRRLGSRGEVLSRYSKEVEVVAQDWRPVRAIAKEEPPAPAHPEDPAVAEVVAEDPPAAIEEQDLPTLETFSKTRLEVYLGAGGNYLSTKQSGSDQTESGQFANFVGPTAMAGVKASFAEKHVFDLQYNRWPGEFKSNSAAAVLRKNQFTWQSYLAEYQYQFSGDSNRQYSLLLGVQNHQIPFLSTGQDGLVDILSNEFLNASVGVKATYLGQTGLEYEMFVRYQSLLSSRSLDGYDFKASPKMMFDGSIGVSKKFSERFRGGLYWFGQYQDYKYDFTRDGNPVQGDQTLLNSNIQIRFGWEFFSILSIASVPLLRRIRRFRKARRSS